MKLIGWTSNSAHSFLESLAVASPPPRICPLVCSLDGPPSLVRLGSHDLVNGSSDASYSRPHSLLRARHLRNILAGSHLYMSDPPNRADLIRLAKGDEKTFIAGYSLVSLGIFVPTTWYWMRHRGTGMRIWNLRCADRPRPRSHARSKTHAPAFVFVIRFLHRR